MKLFVRLLCFSTLITQGFAATPFRPAEAASPRDNPNSLKIRPKVRQPWAASTKSTVDTATQLRGGACNDSDPTLFLKIGINAALETATMVGILVGSKRLSEKVQLFPDLSGLPVVQWLSLFVIIFGSSFLGSIVDGGISTATNQVLDPGMVPGDPDWYAKLVKPSWNPPGWVFPIMWLIVSKPTQLIAVSKILKKAAAVASDTDAVTKLPISVLALYCAHLSLGDAWNKVFFGLQCTGRAAAVVTAFFGLLLTSAYVFYTIDPSAGLFMLPTCGWVLVASALNWNIYLNNK
jgi:benzodiazapine receptor